MNGQSLPDSKQHQPPTQSVVGTPESDSVENSPFRDRIVTIPNIICALRLLGSFVLFGVALSSKPQLFAVIFTTLSLSDWIDGKLARWLNQRSEFGARFDSLADSILYGALFFGLFWLEWPVMKAEAAWWIVGLLSYVLTTSFGLWKFGKIPSYHTYGAKTTQWLILGAALALLFGYSVWPLRIAMICVTLTNLEATAMTWILKEWRADILSILHVLPRDKATTKSNPGIRD